MSSKIYPILLKQFTNSSDSGWNDFKTINLSNFRHFCYLQMRNLFFFLLMTIFGNYLKIMLTMKRKYKIQIKEKQSFIVNGFFLFQKVLAKFSQSHFWKELKLGKKNFSSFSVFSFLFVVQFKFKLWLKWNEYNW